MLNLFNQFLLTGDLGSPFFEWLQIDEELGVEAAGRVCSVVRPTKLRDYRDDLLKLTKNPSYLSRDLGRLLKRNIHRHRGPHPEIPFLQGGHELAADKLHGNEREGKQENRRPHD